MTEKQSYLGCRGQRLTIWMTMTVVLPTYFLIGYNNAVFGSLLTLPAFVEQFPQTDTSVPASEGAYQHAQIQGTVVAIYLVGCMIGALSCISLGDKLGRKKVTVVGGIVAIIGCIMHACAFSLGLLIAGRIVLGLGFGALSSTVPIWQAECCPARHRGALMALQGAFVCVGLTVSQWLTFGLFFTSGSVTWRVPVAFPIVPLVLLLAFIPFLPDSPRWLVKVGRFEEARHIMGIFEDAPDDSTQVQENLHKIQRSLEIMGAAKLTDILSNKENKLLHRTLIAMFSASAQQISGTGVIGAYTAIIFEEYVGLSAIDARIVSACLFMWQILVSFVSCYAIDRVGRRALLMFGITGMGVTLAIIGGTTSNPTNKACSVVAAVSVFLFTAFLGVGVLGVSYMYGAEVAPLSHRVPIYAMTSLVLWSCNFLIVEVTPVALAHMAWRFFFIWAGVNLCLILPIIYFLLPETRRLSLEDIDIVFRSAKGPFDVVRIANRIIASRQGTDGFQGEEYDEAIGGNAAAVLIEDAKSTGAVTRVEKVGDE